MYDLSTLYTQNAPSSWTIICTVLAFIGAVAAAFYFLRPQVRRRYTGWLQTLNAHINFQKFVMPGIVKFLYVFSVLYVVFNGIVSLFTGGVIAGVLMIVLAPVAIRVGYELIMMLFSIHERLTNANRLLQGSMQQKPPMQHTGPYPPQPGPQDQPEQPKHYPGGYDPLHRG